MTIEKLDFHPDTNTVTPSLKIDSAARIGPIAGAKISSSRLRGLLPIYESDPSIATLLERGLARLGVYFKARDFSMPPADYQTACPQRRTTDRLLHQPGVRHKIAKLEFRQSLFRQLNGARRMW